MASREKEIMLKLLELYRDMPFLWNKTHEDYKNPRFRKKGYQILLDVYKIYEPNATTPTMMKRLHNLRSYYVAELKKVRESIRNGGAEYVPHIYYYDAFSFLEPYLECTGDSSDTQEIEHIEPMVSINTGERAIKILSEVRNQAKEMIQEMLTNSPSNPQLRRSFRGAPGQNKLRSKTTEGNIGNFRSNAVRNKTTESDSASNDEFQIFGLYVTTQLKSLSEEQSLIAREKIQTILFGCRLQDLKRKNALSSEFDASSTAEMENVQFVSVDRDAKRIRISSSNIDAEIDSDSDADILKDNFIVQVGEPKPEPSNADSESSP